MYIIFICSEKKNNEKKTLYITVKYVYIYTHIHINTSGFHEVGNVK